MVGGLVTVAGAGTASALALPPAPGSCAVYIQGPIDPASGNLPPDLLPLKWSGQDYSVAGEVAAGDGSKIISDLRHTGVPLTASTRFKANLKINQTPVLSQVAAATSQPLTVNSTNLLVQWKNDTKTGIPTNPTVLVKEAGKLNGVGTAINAVKATAAGVAAATGNQGASLGNVATAVVTPALTPTTQTLQLNIARNVTSGTFKLVLNIPGVPGPPETGPLNYNDSDATIKANIDGVFSAVFGPLAPTTTVTTEQL